MKRNRWRWMIAAVAGGALCGCLGSTVERHVVYQAECARRFAELVRVGQTTREEEQAYIAANERAWRALREAMGIGVRDAGMTREESSDGIENHKSAQE